MPHRGGTDFLDSIILSSNKPALQQARLVLRPDPRPPMIRVVAVTSDCSRHLFVHIQRIETVKYRKLAHFKDTYMS